VQNIASTQAKSGNATQSKLGQKMKEIQNMKISNNNSNSNFTNSGQTTQNNKNSQKYAN
jgi:arginine repressor